MTKPGAFFDNALEQCSATRKVNFAEKTYIDPVWVRAAFFDAQIELPRFIEGQGEIEPDSPISPFFQSRAKMMAFQAG